MEEKESTLSGSPEYTESGSPTPISFVGVGGANGYAVVSAPASGDPGSVLPSSAAVSGAGGGSGESMRKKRGRPRKFDAEGNLSYAYVASAARRVAAEAAVPPPSGFSLNSPLVGKTTTYDLGSGSSLRGRGKHSAASSGGHGDWHPLGALGELLAVTAGSDFTPHVLNVQTGEDVAAKIHSFGQKGLRGICVLSANGPVSSVTIRQPESSGGLLTYEGRFEILSLSGSYTISEAGGVTTRNGGLSITLAGPDGRVVGGTIAGWITAANPIQVVIGSFAPNGYKPQKRNYHWEPPTSVMNPVFSGAKPAEISNAQPMQHHEAGPPAVSPLRAHSLSEADDSIGSGHNLNVVSSHNTQEWNNGSEPRRLYPDINASVPGV